MLGRMLHIFVDAMLISVVLSGIKRNTGLTLAVSRFKQSRTPPVLSAYLEAGEWVCCYAHSVPTG